MVAFSTQPGLFDDGALTQSAERAAARVRMREMIDGLRAAVAPPWTDEMGVILRDGAFQRAMRLMPEDEAQALWADYNAEMERLYAIWAGGTSTP